MPGEVLSVLTCRDMIATFSFLNYFSERDEHVTSAGLSCLLRTAALKSEWDDLLGNSFLTPGLLKSISPHAWSLKRLEAASAHLSRRLLLLARHKEGEDERRWQIQQWDGNAIPSPHPPPSYPRRLLFPEGTSCSFPAATPVEAARLQNKVRASHAKRLEWRMDVGREASTGCSCLSLSLSLVFIISLFLIFPV